MISLRPARWEELETFDAMDRQEHARRYVLPTGLETHRKNFRNPLVSYLSIEDEQGDFCGYFILVSEPDTASVEFRRILIDQHKRGVGQQAIDEMERHCNQHLNASRIWLDVFEDNPIGIHIYEKLGYVRFKQETSHGRTLLFYEKNL